MTQATFDPTRPIPNLEHLRACRSEYREWPMADKLSSEPLVRLAEADIKVPLWANGGWNLRVRRSVIQQLKTANQLLTSSVVRNILEGSAELKVVRAYDLVTPYQTGGVIKVQLMRADGHGTFELAGRNSGTDPRMLRPEYFEGHITDESVAPNEEACRNRRVLFWVMVEAGFGPDPALFTRFGTGDRLGAWSRSHDPHDPLSSALTEEQIRLAIYDDVDETAA